MAQFKRFNASENDNWDTGATYPEGTLTWDPDNGLRIHDGNTGGGNSIGGFSGNFYDLSNRPNGNTAVHDLQGGSSSDYNGYFLKQTSTGVSEWTALPTTYDTLTIDTKIIGGIDGAGGTQITGIEASLGSGVPWRYAFLGGNDAFGNLFNRGSSIIGWKMYPASNPSAFVTITEFLNNDLGAPSLGFDGSLGNGPWVAESSDYSAGANGPLTLSADTLNWTLGTDGYITLPAGGSISDFDAGDGDASVGSSLTGSGYSQIYWDGAPGTGDPYSGSDLFTWMYVDYEGITLGYANASETKDFEWKFNTSGNLVLPAGGDIKDSNGNSVLSAGGGNPFNQDLNTGDSVEFSYVYISASSGNEGGEMRLALPQTNTTLSGTAVTIDVYQNKLRIFEQGGDARGVYIDLTEGTANAGTNLLAGGGGGTSLPSDASGVLKNDGTGTLSWGSLDVQDLTDAGNVLNFTQTQADWTENNAASPAYIQNRPTIITSYNQLDDKPNLFDGSYNSLSGAPSLSAVATTGMYGDLSGTPTNLSSFMNDAGFITGTPWQFEGYATSTSLATVATSGSYNDLSNTPTVPTDVSDLTDNTGMLPAAQVRYVMQNTSFTAEAGKIYWLDSGTSAKTMTLPANPTAGDWVKVYDGSLGWQTYNLTVNGNGNNIKTYNMGGGGWSTASGTATLNQQMISPVGPFPASFIWDGFVWYGAM